MNSLEAEENENKQLVYVAMCARHARGKGSKINEGKLDYYGNPVSPIACAVLLCSNDATVRVFVDASY